MGFGDAPIIKIELDQMRHTIIAQLSNYNDEMEKTVNEEMKKAIENFDYKGTITQITNREIHSAIENSIKDYFNWRGEGKKIIDDSVTSILDNILKK